MRGQRPTDEDQRGPLDRLGGDLRADRAQRSAHDALVGTTRPNHDRGRTFRAIGRQKLIHNRIDRLDGKMNHQRCTGRGAWIYLGLAMYRQFPEGVPGPYRLDTYDVSVDRYYLVIDLPG